MDNKDSQRDENEVWLPTPQLQEEREEHLTTGTKISPALKSEPFSVQKKTFEKGLALPRVEVRLLKIEVNKRNHSDLRHKQEKRSLSTTTEHVTKRHRPEEAAQEETNELSHDSNLCTSQTVVDDCNYTCPLDSDEATDSENDDNRKDLQNPTTSDIHSDPESSCVGTQETFFTTTSSCLPTLTQLDQRGQCGGKEKAEVPRPCLYVPYKYDMEEEEMETESNMWKLRANRVQQILFSLDKKYSTFRISKRCGLEYNVGFGPKQNFSIDSLSTSVLLEISKFALAMNSSQADFIMEILEYNFDFGHWSEGQRKSFTSKLMDRVRWLKNCEDAVKLSKEACESPDIVSSVNMANQSMGSVKPEFSCMSRAKECDVAPTCSSDSQAETKEHKVDLYPFCKDIGLKLNVISSQENKKLDINKLTDGAMTEVTNFAEKLCGTFDQICLDILRHNFDLDWQREDADLAETILTRIPIIVEYRNLSSLRGFKKFKNTRVDFSTLVMDYMECPNIDTCSAASSQAPTIDQNVGSSADNNHQNELSLWLWKLRSNQTKQILSVPHLEHCPLYSYSRCKKSGIDFNVGSGVKRNFDPSKYLTHGIMVEISTFAAALLSAQKEFITEILEYNFDLNFKNELCRSVFAQEIERSCGVNLKTNKPRYLNMPFELPDSRVINESTCPKASYCPKCYQDRNSELCQDESDLDHLRHPHPHCMTDTVSSASNCLAQKPEKDLSAAFQAAEETIMDSYPLCRKIGLSLCVDRDKPKVKLDTSTLTRAVMKEIVSFSKRLCGTVHKLTNDVLEHNFNFGILQSQNCNPSELFYQVVGKHYNKGLTWFNDIFVVFPQPYRNSTGAHRQSENQDGFPAPQLQEESKQLLTTGTKISPQFKSEPWKEDSATQKNERKEMTKKRMLALLTKKEEAAMLSKYTRAVKAKKCQQSSEDYYPICKGIVLDLDSENPTSTDIHSESEPSCLVNHQPLLPTTDGSLSLPTVNFNMNPSFGSQSNERGLFGTEEKIEFQQNVSYKYDMEEEEMETESNMWRLRANRVQQIFLLLDNEYCTLKRSKRLGLEYDVGFGPKQNFSVDSLNNSMLLEIAKFALAMNSSQEYFIMEILEYNFDHWSEDQKKGFASELMDRVRWLKNCEDAVKLSKETFELPALVSSINMFNQSMGIVNPEFSCMSGNTKCDVAPTCSSDPHAEAQEHKVDLYPFCKDIGLKLNVISSQENKKLDINKLTNGAMTEVTNFAEKLCGTFDQICQDILRHNFDLDSDLAKMIVAKIPIILEQKRLGTFMSVSRKKYTVTDFSPMAMGCQKNANLDAHNHTNQTSYKEIKHTIKDLPEKKDCQDEVNLDTRTTGFSQAPSKTQYIRSSTDTEQDNETNLLLWTLRETQIQQILTVPHGEHCPFYSYSRCKTLGIDFNVGSGIKLNFDPSKFLTNGIMLEISTLAATLESAQKEFITEILEHNFHLNLNNEVFRSVFAQRVFDKVRAIVHSSRQIRYLNMPVELPDLSSIDQSTYAKGKYCPKCYQDRNSKLFQDQDHAMTDTVFAEANCSAQKPTKDLSLAFQAAEEKIMNSYPLCKKIGLSLCVDKAKPRRKLDLRVLTRGVIKEVFHFAKRLCATKSPLTRDVLEHNFNIQCQDLNPVERLQRIALLNNGLTWFNDIFVICPCPYKSHKDVRKWKEDSAVQENERKETTKKRKLALLTKKEEAATLTDFTGAVKVRTPKLTHAEIYPVCSKIGLDLDVTSKSGKKKKLNLKLLTTAAVVEIDKFLKRRPRYSYQDTLYEILDYNFGMRSQNYRRWEFSIATACEVKLIAKSYQYNLHRANEVFKLPFVFKQKASNGSVQERQKKETGKSHQKKTAVQPLRSHSAVSHADFLDVNTYKELWMGRGTASLKHPGTTMQMTVSPGRSVCDSPLQEDLQNKEDGDDSHYGFVKPEPVTSPEADMTTKAAQQLKSNADVSHACLIDVQANTDVCFHEEDIKSETYPETIKQLTRSQVSAVCDGPLQENIQIQEDSYHVAVKPEPVSEEISEPIGSLGYNVLTICPPSESNIKTESEKVDEPQVSEGCRILAVCPNTDDVMCEIIVESAESQELSEITTHQDIDSTSVKIELENLPVVSNYYDVV